MESKNGKPKGVGPTTEMLAKRWQRFGEMFATCLQTDIPCGSALLAQCCRSVVVFWQNGGKGDFRSCHKPGVPRLCSRWCQRRKNRSQACMANAGHPQMVGRRFKGPAVVCECCNSHGSPPPVPLSKMLTPSAIPQRGMLGNPRGPILNWLQNDGRMLANADKMLVEGILEVVRAGCCPSLPYL